MARDPYTEKALDYERQRRVGYPQRFRNSWPRKLARIERAHRRGTAQALRQATGRPDVDAGDQAEHAVRTSPRKRAGSWSWGSPTLGQHVEWTLANRLDRTAWNFFKDPYDSASHRAPFAAFLAAVTSGGGRHGAELAARAAAILAPRPGPRCPGIDDRAAWLAAFLRDEPAWRGRLDAWIEATATDG